MGPHAHYTHRHTRVIVEERLQTVAAGLRLKPSAAGDGVRQGINSGRVLRRRGEPAVCCTDVDVVSVAPNPKNN